MLKKVQAFHDSSFPTTFGIKFIYSYVKFDRLKIFELKD